MAKLQRLKRLSGKRGLTPQAPLFGRTFARTAIAALILGCAALGARAALAQDDDWSVVSSHRSESQPVQSHRSEASRPAKAAPSQAEPSQDEHGAPEASAQEPEPAADGAEMICGEMARPAAEPYKSIVANIDREWGIDAPVYESVRPSSPHVSRAGCIFYNPAFMEVFLRGETDEHGEPDKTSMIYAIMAHELGHIEHHDYERTSVSSVNKELQADRFSGYTLSRLSIPRDNITPFYSLGGDEFSGVHDHGFSSERIAAFDKGWKAAEWKRPENDDGAVKNAYNGAAADGDASESDDDSGAAAVP